MFQDIPNPEKRQTTDTFVDVVSLAVELDLLIGRFNLLLFGCAVFKFGSRYFQNASTDAIKLISHTFVDDLLEQRSEEIDASVQNDQTFNIAIILIDFDLIYLNERVLSLSCRMSKIALAALPLP